MSRVRPIGLLFGGVVAMVAFTAGCRVTVETKNRFVEDGVNAETVDWQAGDQIDINIDGVGVSVNGGVDVDVEQGGSKVSASARMLAMAFANDKALADQSIVEAKGTFHVTKAGSTITVRCQHGNTHGSSNGGESGCEKVVVRIPAGSDTAKLKLNVLSGNGSVNLKLSGSSIEKLGVNAQGDTDAILPGTPGGDFSIVAEKSDDIVAHLPDGFAADTIVLQADQGKVFNDFSDAKLGEGAGGRGTAGSGLKYLKLTSKQFAGSSGTVRLTR
jgi:hypothetical protein